MVPPGGGKRNRMPSSARSPCWLHRGAMSRIPMLGLCWLGYQLVCQNHYASSAALGHPAPAAQCRGIDEHPMQASTRLGRHIAHGAPAAVPWLWLLRESPGVLLSARGTASPADEDATSTCLLCEQAIVGKEVCTMYDWCACRTHGARPVQNARRVCHRETHAQGPHS